MTALDFPSSPTYGDIYAGKFKWDGEKWIPYPTGVGLPLPATATYDGAVTNVVMSNGNLTATYNGLGSYNGTRSTAGKSSGKYYFEVTVNQFSGSLSGDQIGILKTSASYIDMNALNANVSSISLINGKVWSNNGDSGKSIGAVASSNVIGVAADLGNLKIWFRKNGGNWNGLAIGSENPATNLGGAVVSAGTYSPALFYNWVNGDGATGNFGATAFGTAAPSGFTGWTV